MFTSGTRDYISFKDITRTLRVPFFQVLRDFEFFRTVVIMSLVYRGTVVNLVVYRLKNVAVRPSSPTASEQARSPGCFSRPAPV